MYYLALTLDSPAENLALDEALLDAHEAGEITGGVLRLWESTQPMVVLGRSCMAEVEVNLASCQQNRIPVLRRCSGGGTIVAGPGCLMYAVILDFATHPHLRAIDVAHEFILGRIVEALSPLRTQLTQAGISDLAIRASASNASLQKFSGNALRIKRNHLLYHGTLLYDFELDLATKLLGSPQRQPEYRDYRSHNQFITNLSISQSDLQQALKNIWHADQLLTQWPQKMVTEIIKTKYHDDPKWVIYHP